MHIASKTSRKIVLRVRLYKTRTKPSKTKPNNCKSNMGSYYSQIAKIFSLGQRECRILILGLDAAGKTTILYSLKMGEKVETIPTIGFNVESLQYKKLNFVVWDVGGQDRIRALWKHYYQGTHGLIFVVDSQDDERLLEAKELESILENHEMNDVPVLIFANKQDLDGALKVNQIAERMALTRKTNKWFVQPACATSGQGLYEGLDWLAEKITSSNYH